MAELVQQFKKRSLLTKPEGLVQGWPKDYLGNYAHPVRNEQLLRGMAEPLRRLDAWMAEEINDLAGFLFYGPPGYGKTSVALTCLLHCARKGYMTRFATAENIAAQRSSTTFKHSEGKTEMSLLEELMAPEVLVLDDIATREYSSQVRATLFNLIRERKSERHLTLLTTNTKLGFIKTGDQKKDVEQAEEAERGRYQFSAALDARALSSYTGQAFNCMAWGTPAQPAASLRGAA
jgi:hypothetical protein